ncbi:MAG: hypothetical protein LC754_08345, partial [Acidobacteria bacterium]|nr:hypothetical protein [Acidobacteriota bacterium]
PLASISGHLNLEPLRDDATARSACAARRSNLLPQEIAITARQEEQGAPRTPLRPPARATTAPVESGDFTLRSMEPGRYRLTAQPLDENWYVRAVEVPTAFQTASNQTSSKPPATRTPQAATGIQQTNARVPDTPASNATAQMLSTLDLKAGQQLKGVGIRVAEGAASLSGLVTPAAEGTALPASALLRVHLVPADRAQADDPLRHSEATPAGDGTFAFKQLAPGRYLLLVRAAAAGSETPGAPPRLAAWDAAQRARLRLEAEAASVVVELEPCRTRSDFALSYPPAGRK